MRKSIEDYWLELADILREMPFGMIERAAELLLDCYRSGGTIFVVGNGGSAATASHFACDLAKGTRIEGLRLFRVVSLTDNVPLLTAWANDTAYEHVFAEQLANLIRPADVVVAISASGDSPNILAAVKAARQAGATTIGWTGESGGKLRPLAHLLIRVPGGNIEQVEDAHLIVGHSLCVTLRQHLQGVEPSVDSHLDTVRETVPVAELRLVEPGR